MSQISSHHRLGASATPLAGLHEPVRLGPWPRTEQIKDAGPSPPEAYAAYVEDGRGPKTPSCDRPRPRHWLGMKPLTRGALLTGLALALAACAIEPLPAPGQASRPQSPIRQEGAPPPPPRRADPRDIARISRLMIPLLRVAERHRPVDQVRVGILDDPSINAASAGEGKFFVTRGLLERATDEQLQAVLAHEV